MSDGRGAWDRAALGDYAVTFALSVAATVLTVLAVAMFARILDEAAFFEFTLANRYLGLLSLVANLGVGFAYLRETETETEGEGHASGVAALAARCIAAALVPVLAGWVLWSIVRDGGEANTPAFAIVLAGLWAAGQAYHHLSGPVARRAGGGARFAKLTVLTHFVAPGCGLLVALLLRSWPAFYIVWGGGSLIAQVVMWPRAGGVRPVGAFSDAAFLLRFSASRWIDGLVRAAIPVAFVLSAELAGGPEFAGVVAVVYLLSKTVESLLQQVVVAVMARAPSAAPAAGVVYAWLVAGAITIVIYLGAEPVRHAVVLLLGERYAYLSEEAWIVLLGTGALVALAGLRALHDNRFQISPAAGINAIALLAVPPIVLIADGLGDVAVGIVALQVTRLFAYSVAIARRSPIGTGLR